MELVFNCCANVCGCRETGWRDPTEFLKHLNLFHMLCVGRFIIRVIIFVIEIVEGYRLAEYIFGIVGYQKYKIGFLEIKVEKPRPLQLKY